MPRRALIFALLVAVLAAAGLWLARQGGGPAPTGPFTAPEMAPMTPDEAAAQAHLLAPALLLTVYRAFGETEEAAIYDTLATAAHGEALQALYLERAGALAGSGLSSPDQTIHEMRLTSLDTTRRGATLEMDATWHVVGIVGHATHRHIRGNTYRARLTVAPSEGAWKITGFDLLEVDRTGAGTVTIVEQG